MIWAPISSFNSRGLRKISSLGITAIFINSSRFQTSVTSTSPLLLHDILRRKNIHVEHVFGNLFLELSVWDSERSGWKLRMPSLGWNTKTSLLEWLHSVEISALLVVSSSFHSNKVAWYREIIRLLLLHTMDTHLYSQQAQIHQERMISWMT